MSDDRGVELRAARVDLDAVARGEQDDLGEVLAQRRGRGSPSTWRDAGTATRSTHLHRCGAVVETDDDHRHERSSSLASDSRPSRIRSRMPESMAARQSESSLERPPARISSRASLSRSEEGLVLGSHLVADVLLEVGREGRAATVRADRDHDIPAPDDRHEGERAVRGVVGRVHEDPARLAGLEHGPVHRRARRWR